MSETDERELLEGPAIEPALSAAAGALLGTLEAWSLRGLHHRPAAGITGIYAVRCDGADGPFDGFLCVSTRNIEGDFRRSVRLEGPGSIPLLVWSHPNDPLLPDLPWACDAPSVGRDLFGVPAAALTTLGYRPMRRAVLRAEAAGELRFLKVVQHGRAALLRHRHELLHNAGIPVPPPVDSPAHDVVVTLPVPGVPLAQRLMVNGASELDPRALVGLLAQLPPTARNLPERPPWSARVQDYARAAAVVLPAENERILVLASRVEEMIRAAPSGPVVPTHGDFYEGNLLVRDGSITGVLDLDSVGPGHLVDDLACFLAHLAVLPCVDARYTEVPAALVRFQQAFEEVTNPFALRARAAGVALTLIAGARRPGQDAVSGTWRADALGRLRVAEDFLKPDGTSPAS